MATRQDKRTLLDAPRSLQPLGRNNSFTNFALCCTIFIFWRRRLCYLVCFALNATNCAIMKYNTCFATNVLQLFFGFLHFSHFQFTFLGELVIGRKKSKFNPKNSQGVENFLTVSRKVKKGICFDNDDV